MLNRLSGALAAFAILASASAWAQTLSTTVNVDRVVEPSLRQATRPTWAPQMLPITTQDVRLTPADNLGQETIISTMTPLPPLWWADVIEHTPYHGYASLGYFPAVNLGANAGYRFVDKENTGIGAWMQYNGYQYNKWSETNSADRKVKLSNHTVTVGAYANHRVSYRSLLDVNVDYTYANVLRPSWTRDKGCGQGSNEFNARLGWRSSAGRFGYGAWGKFQYFGFADSDIEMLGDYGRQFPPIRQSFTTLHADLAYLRGHYTDVPAKFEVGIEWQHLHTAQYGAYDIFKLNPRFNIGTGDFRATLGINIISGGTGSWIADDLGDYLPVPCPDIRLSWAPASLPLSIYANLAYDDNMVPVSSLFAIDPYVSTREYYPQNITMRADVGVNLGAFKGFSAKLFASFGGASNNPYPFATIEPSLPVWANEYGGTEYYFDDMTSFKLGARVDYAYSSLVDAYVSYEFVPENHGYPPYWYQWLDGASSSLRAHAAARPIPHLSVALDYELRSNRRISCYNSSDFYNREYSLGTSSLLDLTASYDINPALTLFLRAENLLNCNYLLLSALPAQGIHGLLGATLKF